jgi:hypothetical protein
MVTPGGKSGPLVPFTIKNGTEHQLRQGVNDYTGWFANDPDMAGEYYGYDGPCPPWNDERVHTYVFTCTRWTSRACRWRGGSPVPKRAWPSRPHPRRSPDLRRVFAESGNRRHAHR